MKGLLASCSDTARTCIAVDTARILTNQDAYEFFVSSVRYVGRYLTGTARGADRIRRNKAMPPVKRKLLFKLVCILFPSIRMAAIMYRSIRVEMPLS